ncbi:MAG: glucoamylase family protein, partial [Longimicrobiales bacterium]
MSEPATGDKSLTKLQRDTFGFFLKETNPENGLVPDSTRTGAPSSIAAVGFGLAAYAIGVERGFITRTEAVQ